MASPARRISQASPPQETSRRSTNHIHYHFSITTVANSRFQPPQQHSNPIICQTITHQNLAYVKFLDDLDKLDPYHGLNPAKIWCYLTKNRSKWKISFDDHRIK